MDHTRINYARLFDALLEVLDKHRDAPRAEETRAYLRAAKFNYLQQDLDHMVGSLVLALHSLTLTPCSPELQSELRSVLRKFVDLIARAPDEMRRLAEEYEANGGTSLSRDQILEEVSERRGALR